MLRKEIFSISGIQVVRQLAVGTHGIEQGIELGSWRSSRQFSTKSRPGLFSVDNALEMAEVSSLFSAITW